MIRRLWSLALASLIGIVSMQGCYGPKAPEPGVPVHMVLHGDEGFSAEERKEIEEGASMWRDQTGGLANLKIQWDLKDQIHKGPCEDKHCILKSPEELMVLIELQSDMSPGSTLALTMPSGGVKVSNSVNILIVPSRGRGYLTMVSAHELGHAMGLPHVGGAYAIMRPYMKGPHVPCLTQLDISTFCSVHVCGDVKMRKCE